MINFKSKTRRKLAKISKQSQGVCTNPKGQTYQDPKHACLHDLTVDTVFDTIVDYMGEP